MDSVKVFKGYGKVDNIEDQSTTSHQNLNTTTKTKRSLITIITISSILLLTLIIGASLLALIHESTTESSEDETPSLSSNSNPAQSIKLVCNVTRYPDSCFTSISSLDAFPKPDPESIFKLSLRVSISELSTLSSFIKNVTSDSNSNGPKSGDSALKDCQELLDEAVNRLKESAALMEVVEGEKALTERKISDIQTWVSAAMTDQETCMDGLKEMESTVLIEVKGKVQKCREYMSNTLAIVANIHTLLDKFGLTLH